MEKKLWPDYQIEDFVTDETFLNYYFNSDKNDHLLWEERLERHPEKIQLAKEAIEIIEALSLTIPDAEYQNEFIKMQKAIDKLPSFSERFKLRQFPEIRFTRRRKFAYTIFLLLLVFSGWFLIFKPKEDPTEKLTKIANNTTLPKVVTLSDSSVVTLEPHSYIQYPSTFKDKVRNVFLHGNASFTVKRDTKHPFKVHAENIVATVLGTVFNIKKSGDSAIVVELLRGKLNVEIMNPEMKAVQSVLLSPNERAVYVKNDKHLYKNFIVEKHTFSFDKSNFDEVAAQLKSAFGITLLNESSKRNWRFTGEFKNSTIKEIVENICLVENLSYVTKGDTIVIK